MLRHYQFMGKFRGSPATALAICLLGLVGCSPMPPAVDSRDYVPLTLAPASLAGVRDRRSEFRALFCSEPGVATEAMDNACEMALRRFSGESDASAPVPALEALPRRDYRIAIALGIGWDCVRDLIDEQALPAESLRAYGYDTRLLEIEGLSSSERNADFIAQTLLEADGEDPRPLILIGYSKGATDLLLALERHPALAERSAALVSIAGAVGGSPVADNASSRTTALLRLSPYGDCGAGDGGALESLRPVYRHAWLEQHLPLPIPSYSLVTAPEPDRVSPALRSSFKLLGTVHPLNDGALLHWDQLLPGSTLLGYVNADHWAVAVPVEVEDIPLGSLLVRNGYPRQRLWRAVIDFVIADLESSASAQR